VRIDTTVEDLDRRLVRLAVWLSRFAAPFFRSIRRQKRRIRVGYEGRESHEHHTTAQSVNSSDFKLIPIKSAEPLGTPAPARVYPDPPAGFAQRPNVALVCHIFHMDVVPSLVKYVANFPPTAERLISYPTTATRSDVETIRKLIGPTELFAVENIGQDAGALLQVADKVDLAKYDVVCKIHTKKGLKWPTAWRETLLNGVLPRPYMTQRIINAFNRDPQIGAAGPRSLYLYGPNNQFQNAAALEKHRFGISDDFDFRNADWGFFAGSMLWMRGSLLAHLAASTDIQWLRAEANGYFLDGTIAHAMERAYGAIIADNNLKTLLTGGQDRDGIHVCADDFCSDCAQTKFDAATLFSGYINDDSSPDGSFLKGHLNTGSTNKIHGWLADRRSPSSRTAQITIDGVDLVTVEAEDLRDDLVRAGIGAGAHGFSARIPLLFRDGMPHLVTLLDAETGQTIAQHPVTWDKAGQSEFQDLESYLRTSFTMPFLPAPFTEQGKRVLAVIDDIADARAVAGMSLSKAHLVSVIMPVYNRAGTVLAAIESVLAQTHQNLELLIIDDGSDDDLDYVLATLVDERITVLRIPCRSGQPKARNIGLRFATGDFIAYLDSDNTWDPRYLAASLAIFEEDHGAELIATGMYLYEGRERILGYAVFGHLHQRLLENTNYIDINTIVHRRAMLEKIGLFDEDLTRLVDWDFLLRAIERCQCRTTPLLLVRYFRAFADNTISKMEPANKSAVVVRRRARELIETNTVSQNSDNAALPRLVSVVIPSFESLDSLIEAIKSVQDQASQCEIQDIVVVDNCSSAPVRNYLSHLENKGHIKLVSQRANYGFSHAVNTGLALINDSNDVLLMNNDATLNSGCIAALQKAIVSDPRIGVAVPAQVLPGGEKSIALHVPFADASSDCDVTISAVHKNIARMALTHDGQHIDLTYAPFFVAYISSDVREAMPRLNAELGRHYRSDRIYCDRVRMKLGSRIVYVPSAIAHHQLQGATRELRRIDPVLYKIMFEENSWTINERRILGFREGAPWDWRPSAH
jgi:glycosyltransferase involved in cell wall biosynthesis